MYLSKEILSHIVLAAEIERIPEHSAVQNTLFSLWTHTFELGVQADERNRYWNAEQFGLLERE